jgi:hypothetical protein
MDGGVGFSKESSLISTQMPCSFVLPITQKANADILMMDLNLNLSPFGGARSGESVIGI